MRKLFSIVFSAILLLIVSAQGTWAQKVKVYQVVRRSMAWAMLCLAVCMLGVGVSAGAQKATIVTFDAPGAGTDPGQGTTPNGIDAQGAVVGWYVDAGNVNHGFLRTPDGRFTTIDVPGAGTGAGQGTVAFAINQAGAITGTYFDASCLYHGFLRAPDGTITTVDAPGAGTVGGYCSTGLFWTLMKGTAAQNINAAGTITGIYTDPSGVGHVFLRAPHGTFTTFDAPGAGTGDVQGTWTTTFYGLNPEGAISGWYVDASGAFHGYLRAPKGTVTTFNARGAGRGNFQGTVAMALNPERAVTGFYLDGSNVFHGFLRAPDGKLTTFDVSGGGTGYFQGTYPASNNPAGEITGNYTDTNDVNHGFLRAPDGRFTTFDVPGAGTGAYQGTIPYGNNPAGATVGAYVDANGVSHGFLRIPSPPPCRSGERMQPWEKCDDHQEHQR